MDNSSIRTPVLLVGIFVLLVTIILYLFLTTPDEQIETKETPATTTDVIKQTQQETVQTTVLTKTGTFTETRNFLADPEVLLWDSGASTYLIAQESSPQGDIYQIFYFDGGGITVSLLDDDLIFARSRAEAALLTKLGVDEFGLCALMIRVTTPSFVSEEYSGRELGLSFCPNAVTF